MKNISLRGRGFTLIEVLIVVAIIAILASIVLLGLGPARRDSRDTRRIADMRDVQTILESYYNLCQAYPGGGTYQNAASTCTNNSSAINGGGQPSWGLLSAAIKLAGLANSLPLDPVNNTTNYYQYEANSNGQNYTVAALLENKNNTALNGSLTKDTAGSGIICDQASNPGSYCVGQ